MDTHSIGLLDPEVLKRAKIKRKKTQLKDG
jgi:hypothetical protein